VEFQFLPNRLFCPALAAADRRTKIVTKDARLLCPFFLRKPAAFFPQAAQLIGLQILNKWSLLKAIFVATNKWVSVFW
jgi:hypothetical protein